MKVKDIGEFGLIDRIKDGTLFDSEEVITGIGDDTAVLKQSSDYLLLATTDMMIENIHFILKEDNAKKIGYRVMAANISDIAAMGGFPTHALISIGVAPETDVSIVEDIYNGIKMCSKRYNSNIVGGDTVSSPENLVLNVALLGNVESDRCKLRSGSRVGDLILVTGHLGDSRGGLDLLFKEYDISEEDKCYLLDRHYYPLPRVNEVRAASEAGLVTAVDDISDGLGNEINEIAVSSSVGAEIWLESLPVSNALNSLLKKVDVDISDYVLFGGEDFEVVMTVDPNDAEKIAKNIKEKTGTEAAVVGKIVDKSKGITLTRGEKAVRLDKKGYNHFGK